MYLILIISAAVYLVFLVAENIILNYRIKSIPLRICVTGTRGKSSVVRMLVSILRKDTNKRVLGKITGSKASFLLPDGNEVDISRRGKTSIIEQKKLIKKAFKAKTSCIVAEIMSIQPENHYVEAHRILKPHILIITNIRKDHTHVMGNELHEIAGVFSNSIYKKSKVFVLKSEINQVFLSTIKKMDATLFEVNKGESATIHGSIPEVKKIHFTENIDLVFALCKNLKIDSSTVTNGLNEVKDTCEAIKIKEYRSDKTKKTYYFVNGFSANDPESTIKVISKMKELLPLSSVKIVGILNLRPDRGERTVQWVKTLKNGAIDLFEKVYVTGAHSRIVKRKLDRVKILKEKSPEGILHKIFTETENRSVIFGFGNIKGAGNLLVKHWDQMGDVYGV